MSMFDEAIVKLLADEGDAVCPDDCGHGPSKYGITLATYKDYYPQATEGTIYDMGREQAVAFYRKHFWEAHKIGMIENQEVASKVFNLGVNIGPRLAIKFMQAAVGVPTDGRIGPKTAAAVNAASSKAVLAGIRAAGEVHYRRLAAQPGKKKDYPYRKFLAGWLARLAQ